MFELIWAIINILVFCYAIIFFYNSTKSIRAKLGAFGFFFLVLILLSFISKPISKIKKFDLKNNKTEKEQVSQYSSTVVLDDNLLSDTMLSVGYNKEEPLYAYSDRVGFICGTEWSPATVSVQKTANGSTGIYTVSGTVKWKILGMTFYSQPKKFTGKIKLD